MKRILVLLAPVIALLASPSRAQVIRTVDLSGGSDLSAALGDDKYSIDSLIIKGKLPHSAFPTIRDCVINGKLTGINMGDCQVENDSIPEDGLRIGRMLYLEKEHSITGLTLPKGLRAIGPHGVSHLKTSSLELPSTLRVIDTLAFCDCRYIKGQLRIPEGVTQISREAFYGWESIESVSLPSTLRSIGYRAFGNAARLSEIRFNDGLQSIGELAFHNSGRIAELLIPNSVAEIGKYAFMNCESIGKLVLPDKLTILNEGAFAGCEIGDIAFPPALKTIKTEAISTFTGKTLTLPDGLQTLEDNNFGNLYSTTTLVLPKSLNSVGVKLFTDVSSLISVYAKNSTVPELPLNADASAVWFTNVSTNATLFVPVGSYSAYRSCKMFDNFKTIKETDKFPTAVETVTVQPISDCQSPVYNVFGQRINDIRSGQIYIKDGKKFIAE